MNKTGKNERARLNHLIKQENKKQKNKFLNRKETNDNSRIKVQRKEEVESKNKERMKQGGRREEK